MARKSESLSLSGKVVAITGGARGIGRATAAAFLDAGAVVAVGDIDVELVVKTAAELGAKPGSRVVGLPLDVTDRASFAAFLDEAEAQLGPLDVLVNNAGIMPTGVFADEAESMTDRILDINVRGVITGSRLALQRFASRGSGHLINIASLAGTAGMPGLATYCASKHAVVGFTEAVHLELVDTGVRATAVLPGVVRTELSAGANMPEWMMKVSTVDPEDVAAAIVAALRRNRPMVTVPKSLTLIIRMTLMMPYPLQRAMARLTGADIAFTKPDPAAREIYHRRITGQGFPQ
ncbi:MAG: SDR family oxidoreductase [Mycobacteriaceae bacterium]|nr:SDR family oxidoreductase [Mycobacteriaceae bacterium]